MSAKSNTVLSGLETALTSSDLALVTTRRLDYKELASGEFPAVIIEPSEESQGLLNNGLAHVMWHVALRLSVVATGTLSATENWREQAALIGTLIASDRTLGGTAIDTQVVSRQQDLGVYEPYATGSLGLTITYRFNELTEGG